MEKEKQWTAVGEQYKVDSEKKDMAMLTFVKPGATKEELARDPSLASHFDYIMVDQTPQQVKKGTYFLKVGSIDARAFERDKEAGPNEPQIDWEHGDLETLMPAVKRALESKYSETFDDSLEVTEAGLLKKLDTLGVDRADVLERSEELENSKGKSIDDWQDFGSEKISDLNQDADLILIKPSCSEKEREEYPDLATNFDYIYVRQEGFPYEDEKVYYMTTGSMDVRDSYPNAEVDGKSVEDLAPMAAMACRDMDSYEMKVMDKPVLFHRLEGMGVNLDEMVERKEDLGDFRSPVVYHDQSKEEKSLILSEVADMKPGDELTYTATLTKQDEQVTEKYRFACIDKDTLLRFEISPNNLVAINRHVQDEKIPKWKMRDDPYLMHWNNNYQSSQALDLEDVRDIKINRDRFTKEEVEALSTGKSIDYNKVSARREIPDREDYLSYVINHSRGDTRNVHDAFMKGARKPSLTNAEYYQMLSEIRQTERAATASKSPVIPAISVLREAGREVTHEGLEGEKMALACESVADGLARGKGWNLAVHEAEEKHPSVAKYMDAVETVTERFVEINKGIEGIVEKRELSWMKDRENAVREQKAGIEKGLSSQKEPQVVVQKDDRVNGKGRV